MLQSGAFAPLCPFQGREEEKTAGLPAFSDLKRVQTPPPLFAVVVSLSKILARGLNCAGIFAIMKTEEEKQVIDIAIIEDSNEAASALVSCLERFGQEENEQFKIVRYTDADAFLSAKQPYDIIFMDIRLPNITGMEAAERLRKFDKTSVLIFVTSMAQFALKSYEVDALDYILKPVSYRRVTLKLRKAVEIVKSREDRQVVINHGGEMVRLSTAQILYVEVRGHKLSYHTDEGVLSENGSLSSLEASLRANNFMRCNACYLVNPRRILSVKKFTVCMDNGDELSISQPRRKAFIDELTNWMGQGKC